jgi:hypothetical protein
MMQEGAGQDCGAEAEALVAALQGKGLSLEVVGDQLHVRPAGRLTEEERALVRRLKRDIVSTLLQPGTPGTTRHTRHGRRGAPGAPAQACAPWDDDAADAALAEVGDLLDGALAEGGAATTPSRRAVAELYRRLALGYHASRDPLLFEAPAAAARLLAGWAENEGPVRWPS